MRLLRHVIVFVVGLVAGRKTRSEQTRRAEKALRKRERLPFWLYGWKGFLKRLAVAVPFLLVGGFLLAASGIIPIKASSGHFGITAWFLEFSMARSVSTHSIGVDAPPLDSEALVMKGAGHYETGCGPCHGGVTDVTPQIPRKMTPHPPRLPAMIPKWDPEELFYIVKHGVKFTGMPAFPSLERDDEVWAVVAFLLRLPEMDVPEYQRLVYGEGGGLDVRGDTVSAVPDEPALDVSVDTMAGVPSDTASAQLSEMDPAEAAPVRGLPAGGEPVLVRESCRRCHGDGGSGRGLSAFPRLAGQRPNYTYAALFAYASGERHSGIMEPIAAGMTADEMREIALYYAGADVRPALGTDFGGGLGRGQGRDTTAAAVGPQIGETAGAAGGADTLAATPEAAPRETVRRPGTDRGLDTIIEPKTWAQEARSDDQLRAHLDRSLPASIERGRAIAQQGIPEHKIPSCRDCHGPNRIRTNPFYPVLAGQFAEYLVLQLELFKTGHRGGSPFAHLMQPTASRLTKEQMRDVALYYESLGGGPVTDLDPYIESLIPTNH